MKKAAAASVIIVCAFLLLSTFNFIRRDTIPAPPVYEANETEMKQTILANDVALTDQLCRSQCALAFRQTLARIGTGAADADHIKAALDELRREHGHMDYVVFRKHGGANAETFQSGTVPAAVRQAAEAEMTKAMEAVRTGQPYESRQLGEGDHAFFVLGVPAEDQSASLVGIVRHDVLRRVEADMRKNLRLEPHPITRGLKIKSVGRASGKSAGDQNKTTSHYYVDEVVVKFKKDLSAADMERIRNETGATQSRKTGTTYVFRSSRMEAERLIDYFKSWDVEYAEPHYLFLPNETEPNDTLYSRYQWNLPAIDTIPGWDFSRGAKDVIVAVVDSGVDLNHPDLRDKLVQGANFVDENTPPNDDVGHGTHVAGIISALVNNRQGVAGISWYNPIMPIKVLDQSGAGSTYSVAQGIIWAADHGAKVINLSLGNYANAQFLHDAIKYAYNKDVVLVAASGNDNTEQPGYPAAYPEVLAVAATDSRKQKAPFSNYGDYIDVAAPGVNIASTYPNNRYAALSGTSMASPHVTALAALIRSANPQLKNTEVMDIIRQTAVDLGSNGYDIYFGFGQIDIVNALERATRSQQQSRPPQQSPWYNWLQRRLEQMMNLYKK